MYFVYILESLSNSKWYYGSSADLPRRVLDHLNNRAKYTRFKGPWKLIFARTYDDKSEALEFEKYLKKTRNKVYIRKTFGEYFLDMPG